LENLSVPDVYHGRASHEPSITCVAIRAPSPRVGMVAGMPGPLALFRAGMIAPEPNWSPAYSS
jgi:hypothetical protein